MLFRVKSFSAKLILSIWIWAAYVPTSEARIQIRTAAQDASEPKFISILDSGRLSVGGLCIDVFRALEKIDPELSFNGDQQWLPRSRIEAAMRAGELDLICGIQQTSNKLTQYYFLDTVLFSATYLLVVRANDTVDIRDWKEVRELGNAGIILTLHGFDITELLDEQVGGLLIDSSATSSISNLKKLIAGRGRFYCHRSPGIRTIIKKASLEKQVRVLSNPQLNTQYFMAMSKHTSKNKIYRLSRALTELNASGELRRIVEKYRD